MQTIKLQDRLTALWDHLGLEAAHIAAQMPDEIAEFVVRNPDRIASLTICEAIGLDPAPFQAVANRLTLIAGDGGLSAKVVERVAPMLDGCRCCTLTGYQKPIWADSISDNTEVIVSALKTSPGEASRPSGDERSGEHAEIAYQIQGTGPALVLFPLFLSAAQWTAALPELTKFFTVVVLGGRHLGGVALLEDRASNLSYAGMVRTLIDGMAPKPGETILEVGCGSGGVARLVAAHLDSANSITAIDLNPYLLREAKVLAAQSSLQRAIDFQIGNAETLPFDDAAFDHAYSITVLEECDADLALAELFRVVKPGGRAGVIVRGVDLPHPWHMDLPTDLKQKVDTPVRLIGPGGVADHSLYGRMAAAGFTDLICFPMLASFTPANGTIWGYFESRVLSRLSPEETSVFRQASMAARTAGTLFVTSPHHCVVGRRG